MSDDPVSPLDELHEDGDADVHHTVRGEVIERDKIVVDNSIQVGDITNSSNIRIGHVFINQIVRGLDELPTRYDGLIQSFLEYYLGTKDKPVPFGGRARDLDALDAWLNDPSAPPYAALIAPAGRGKSALLAHWITRLMADEAHAPHVVYFPISIRFGTNLETVAFASLAARMAHIYSEQVTQAFDAQQYRGVFADYARRTPSDSRPVLVVIDGLDEAASWDLGAGLFPLTAISHLRVLIAARPLAGDADEHAWLGRLGWDTNGLAKPLSLGGLDHAGVADVLQKMGNPLDKLAAKIDIVGKLHELSEGDPLLVGLYVEALLPRDEQAAALTPQDLTTLKPGLGAYFQRWFDEQRKLWGADSPLKGKSVRAFLNLLAVALGPLRKSDVLALAPDEVGEGLLVSETAYAVRRLVIGNGEDNGYVFSHSRLSEFFVDQMSKHEYQTWQIRFLKYGKETLAALRNGTLVPCDVSAYLVRHYGAHLIRANASNEEIYNLVCEPWLRAWEWVSSTPDGFLDDVRRAWQYAERAGTNSIGQQMLAALCFASVASTSSNIDRELLIDCVRAGVLNGSTGVALAKRKPDPVERLRCLGDVAELLPSRREQIFSEMVQYAYTIENGLIRARAFTALAEYMHGVQQELVLQEALSAIDSIESNSTNDYRRVQALIILIEYLPESQMANVLQVIQKTRSEWERAQALAALIKRLPESLHMEALKLARSMHHPKDRAEALSALIEHLPEQMCQEVFSDIRDIEDELACSVALTGLTRHLSEPLLIEALDIAYSIKNEYCRARALSVLAKYLSESERETVLTNALRILCMGHDDIICTAGLAHLAGSLTAPLLVEALNIVRNFKSQPAQAEALIKISKYLSEPLLADALALIRDMQHEINRANALTGLVKYLSEPLLKEAMIIVYGIRSEYLRAGLLRTFAKYLPESLLDEAWQAVCTIQDEYSLSFALGAYAARLPKPTISGALHVARNIQNGPCRAEALTQLAKRLKNTERVTVLTEALVSAREITSDGIGRITALLNLVIHLPQPVGIDVIHRGLQVSHDLSTAIGAGQGKLVSAFVDYLPEFLAAEMLREANEIQDEVDRAWTLAALSTKFADPQQQSIMDGALSATLSIEQESTRFQALTEIVKYLPAPLLIQSLESVRIIQNESGRANVLSALILRTQDFMHDSPEEAQSGVGRFFSARAIRSHFMSFSTFIYAVLNRKRNIALPKKRLTDLESRQLIQGSPEWLLAETLEMARGFQEESCCVQVLIALARKLPKSLQAYALHTAHNLKHGVNRAIVLAALAKYLGKSEREDVLAAALRVVLDIKFEVERANALVSLAPYLYYPMLAKSLEAAGKMQDDYNRALVLAGLAEHLPLSLMNQALSITLAIQDESSRVRSIEALAAYLPDSLLADAFHAVSAITVKPNRARLMAMLIGRMPTQQCQEGLIEILHTSEDNIRADLLLDINILVPAIHRLGGEQAIRETAQAIIDTTKWWP